MTAVQIMLVNAWAVLVMAERRELSDAPVELQDEIEIRIAEITIEKLS